MDNTQRRFSEYYPRLGSLNALLDKISEVRESIEGLNGTYILNMGESVSRPGCTTYYVSTMPLIGSHASSIFKVRRCPPDPYVEIKDFNGGEWVPYGIVRTPPRRAKVTARSRARSRSRSRRRRSGSSRSR